MCGVIERSAATGLERHVQMNLSSFRKIAFYILGFAGVLGGVLVVAPLLRTVQRRGGPPPTKPPAVEAIPRRSPEEVARPHLEKAQTRAQEAIDAQLNFVDRYFLAAKKNSRAIAEEILSSWQARYDLARDKVLGGQRLEAFVAQTFRRFAFAPEDLEKLGLTVCEAYRAELDSIDQQLLVDLREDLAETPGYDRLLKLDSQQWSRVFQQSLTQLVQQTQEELKTEAVRQLASIVISELVTQVATRMAISAGILGAGATSGAASLGIGLVAGVVVDQIVGAIYDALYDPVGELAKQIEGRIEEVHQTFKSQLRQRLEEEAQQRSQQRRATILHMLDSTF